MDGREIIARSLITRGRQIFAYNHLRTNQVVYSLDRSMRNHPALKQQAYAGKKTIPESLRKDVWRPLYTVTFSSTQQGLSAFRKLREWKMLHELSWDPKDLPAYPLSPQRKEQREKLNEKLQELNGGRIGGPRAKKSEHKTQKKIMIMNQKANSIADLAAVLLEQDERGAEWGSERKEELEAEEKQLVERVQRLAQKESEGATTKLDKDIEDLTAQVEAIKTARTTAGEEEQATQKQQRQLRNKEAELRMKKYDKVRLLVAKRIVSEVNEEISKTPEQRLETLRQQREKTGKHLASFAGQSLHELDSPPPGPTEVELQDAPTMIYNLAAKEAAFRPRGLPGPLPKKGRKRTAMLREATKRKPGFTAQGVQIRWANPLDAEFAETWPEGVQHDSFGLARHTAPAHEDAPILELQDRIHVRDESDVVICIGDSFEQVSMKLYSFQDTAEERLLEAKKRVDELNAQRPRDAVAVEEARGRIIKREADVQRYVDAQREIEQDLLDERQMMDRLEGRTAATDSETTEGGIASAGQDSVTPETIPATRPAEQNART